MPAMGVCRDDLHTADRGWVCPIAPSTFRARSTVNPAAARSSDEALKAISRGSTPHNYRGVYGARQGSGLEHSIGGASADGALHRRAADGPNRSTGAVRARQTRTIADPGSAPTGRSCQRQFAPPGAIDCGSRPDLRCRRGGDLVAFVVDASRGRSWAAGGIPRMATSM